jgi:DNA polymerase-3 subunit delta
MDAAALKILTDLQARKFAPVYFLQGEEPYYIDLISDYIQERTLQEHEKSFNQVVVYGKDVTIANILTHARRFPMMADRQVVIVKEAQDILDLNKEIGAKLLLDYLGKAVPSTVLVFAHKYKSLDKRKELGKKIDKLSVSLTTKKLYDNQLPDFVSDFVKSKKTSIEPNAVQAFCEFVGNDLNRLANEINKVILTLPAGQTITLDHVMNQVGISKEYNIFELQKAIVNNDTLLVAKIVNYFESNTKKNPIIPVVAFLFSFYSKLLASSAATDKSEKGLVSLLKISPFAARDYVTALRRIGDQNRIIRSISDLKEADLKLKGVNNGTESDGQIFRELMWKLMH